MKKLPLIAIIDQNNSSKEKISTLISDLEVEIVEIHSPIALLSLMAERDYKINLIVTDLIFKSGDSSGDVDILQLIRSKSSQIPIMTFILPEKKDSSAKCLLLGVNEYMLMPIDDHTVKSRIMKYLHWDHLSNEGIVKFNLKDYLGMEIYKAAKGKYSFTMMKIDFNYEGDEAYAGIGNNFHPHSEELFAAFKKMVWDGDTYLQYGFRSHLGFFPFCDKRNATRLIHKLEQKFYEVKSGMPGMYSYKMTYALSCYPNDGCSSDEMLQVLSSRETDN